MKSSSGNWIAIIVERENPTTDLAVHDMCIKNRMTYTRVISAKISLGLRRCNDINLKVWMPITGFVLSKIDRFKITNSGTDTSVGFGVKE